MTQDPLQSLLIDSKAVDRERLAAALNGVAAIDSDTGDIVLLAGFDKMKSAHKIIAVLLARKAAVLLGKAEAEVLSTGDIVRITGLPEGTVKPTLKKLREDRRVRSDNGLYTIPGGLLSGAMVELSGGAD